MSKLNLGLLWWYSLVLASVAITSSLDDWTINFSSRASIDTVTGGNNASVQYFPALNRYVLLTFNYPDGWIEYESMHPGGPWTRMTLTP